MRGPFFLLHTCVYSVYYTCDKPLLYQTGDPLSNTSGQNFFGTAPRLKLFEDFPIYSTLLCLPQKLI